MALTPYCETEAVRATLGVNSIELSDSVLNLPIYSIGLQRELSKLSPSLPASFLQINALPEASRTALEQSLFLSTRMFSVYASARQVGASLGTTAASDIGDGKASVARFSGEPYKDVLERVDKWYYETKTSLLASIALYNGKLAPNPRAVVAFVKSQRTYDPITG